MAKVRKRQFKGNATIGEEKEGRAHMRSQRETIAEERDRLIRKTDQVSLRSSKVVFLLLRVIR